MAALADTPVVLLHGARQVGKSTLARRLAGHDHPARYLTLDDATVLAAARGDPEGFLGGLDGPVVIDEVQRAPELLPAIKHAVDRKRQAGRYLLTGSANVLLVPRLPESLAGRMELVTLWPLSAGELHGVEEGFIDAVFSADLAPVTAKESRRALWARISRGGYPEVVARPAPERRAAWFGAYLTTILQRDVRDLAAIEGLTELPRLLALLAVRSSSLMNTSELSRAAGLPNSTLKRYLSLLETTFLLQLVPPFATNRGKRLVKAPKIALCDTGLAAHLAGVDEDGLDADGVLGGALLESFVTMELSKQIGWSRTHAALYHYRSHAGQEVDLVLEDRRGRVVGIEVKAAAAAGDADFKGLRSLAQDLGPKFHRGVVLYTGHDSVPFGPRLHALPVAALWESS